MSLRSNAEPDDGRKKKYHASNAAVSAAGAGREPIGRRPAERRGGVRATKRRGYTGKQTLSRSLVWQAASEGEVSAKPIDRRSLRGKAPRRVKVHVWLERAFAVPLRIAVCTALAGKLQVLSVMPADKELATTKSVVNARYKGN